MSTRRVKTDVATILASVGDEAGVASGDPVLSALAAAHGRRMKAEEEIRLLLAYGRRFVYPRPYTFGELAAAAGMSVSGVRTAYGSQEIDKVAVATELVPVTQPEEEDGRE